MTERLYYTQDTLEGQAQVIRCQPDAEGRYRVELDKTLFHPQGGGQPADRGWIAGVAVVGVTQQEEHIVHLLTEPLPAGAVKIRIDADARLHHSRLHSAGHLIGLAGENVGWRPVKAHHWPGEGRITFAASENTPLPDASALSALIARWQAEDLPRHISFEGPLRKVGFGALPAYACGGTHVKSLSSLGEVLITQVKLKKGQMIVSYSVQ